MVPSAPRSTALALVAAIVLSLTGCAVRRSPVPVQAQPDVLAALAGEWTGEYTSESTGRSGGIVFSLSAGRDSAFGDVIMVPAGGGEQLVAAAPAGGRGGPGATRPAARALTIRFVRVSGDSVSGVLDPYDAPDCDCLLTTTFTGRVRGNRIEGAFVTRGDVRAAAPQGGRWTVTRRP